MIRKDPQYQPGGLLRISDFLPTDYCQDLCSAGQAGPAGPAGFVTGSGTRHDDRVRKTTSVAVPDHLIDVFSEKLQGIHEMLASKFRLELGGWESPQVLSYGRGGHFSVHQDNGDVAAYPSYVRERVLSVVLFLNSPSAALRDGMYGGGTLTFFSVSRGVTALDCRIPVVGECGSLVVFPSHWHHCVTPVQHGIRWTLVTWIARAKQNEGGALSSDLVPPPQSSIILPSGSNT